MIRTAEENIPVVNTRVYMGDTEYHNVRLTATAYRKLQRRKREGESFSETVDRLAGEQSLLELRGLLTDTEAETVREGVHTDDTSRRELDRLADRLDS